MWAQIALHAIALVAIGVKWPATMSKISRVRKLSKIKVLSVLCPVFSINFLLSLGAVVTLSIDGSLK